MHPSVLVTILFAFVSANDSFTIDQQPPPSVKEGSIQTITWNTNLTLTQVSIDLYQNSRFIANWEKQQKIREILHGKLVIMHHLERITLLKYP